MVSANAAKLIHFDRYKIIVSFQHEDKLNCSFSDFSMILYIWYPDA